MRSGSRAVQGLWRLGPVLALAFAGLLIYRALSEFSLAEIHRSLHLLSFRHLALGMVFTAASYLTLTASDALAVHYARRTLPYSRVAFTSFVALSIGHTLGLGALSSGAIRLRLYSSYGLSAVVVPQIIVFCGFTVLLGLCSVAGTGAVLQPRLSADALGLPRHTIALLGSVLLGVGLTYLTLTAVARREIRVWGRAFRLPTIRMALGQLVVGTLDLLLVAGALHQMLLAASAEMTYFTVLTLYAVANAAAVVTHVPGGLGVIEAVVLSRMSTPQVVGALIAFRVVYYLLPFLIGCVLFGGFELSRRFRQRGSLGVLRIGA